MRKSKSKAAQMHVPKKNRQLFEQIVELIDAFCDTHLNDSYKELCEQMAGAICRTHLPLNKSSPAVWAGGIVHAVGLPGQNHLKSKKTMYLIFSRN